MSQENFLNFLKAVHANAGMLARYSQRNLSEVVFHAKNEGFEFTPRDMGDVIGRLEANVILNKDRDPFDGSSRLWREMWGRCFIEYLAFHVVARHTEEELRQLLQQDDWGSA